MRILVVEDNATYAQLIADGLRRSGFDCDQAACAEQADVAVAKVSYAAILLDLGLPDRDGAEFLDRLRRDGNATPVLIVTARNGLQDRIEGLRSGADDYLAKPFALDELIARLRGLLRRPRNLLGPSLTVGDVVLDMEKRQLSIGGNVQPVWRAREMSTLELLVRYQGNVVPRRVLEDHLFGMSNEHASNVVDVYVHRLRNQLADASASVRIDTIRGIGFILTEKRATPTVN